ncbi:MAG: LPS export ABC transporter permease LptG [Oligoflexales bacterium]|nr:LPS export ABC transporter permease LptG [Oligoflexales bacterium]
MKLYFYVLREYLKYVFGTLVLCVFLFILFDFIHKTTKYIPRYEPSGTDLLQLYYFQIPSLISQALPISALLASVAAMVMLARNNELTAMRAVGMGPLSICLPLLMGGGILCAVGFIVGEVFLPQFAHRMYYLKEVVIEGEEADSLAERSNWFRQGDQLFNFAQYNPETATLHNVRIMKMGSNFRPTDLTIAESAAFRFDSGDWLLDNIRVINFNRSGQVLSNSPSPPEVFILPFKPQELQKDRRKPSEMTLKELRQNIVKAKNSGQPSLDLEVDFHFKLAYPFAALVVSLVGLQFMYLSERTTDTIKGVLMAFGIGVTYWFILIAARALGTRGDVPPEIASWLANTGVLSASLIQTWYRRTQ